MRGAEPENGGDGPVTPSATTTLDWAAKAGATRDVLTELGRLRRKRWKRQGLAATMVVLASGAFLLPWRAAPGSSPPAATANATPPPAVTPPAADLTPAAPGRALVLADGSIIDLQAHAEIDVDYSPGLRRVHLKRGTAYFEVARDPSRPFVVAAEGLEVRAVGTAFAVQLAAQHVEVLVTEGRVRVDRPLDTVANSPTALEPLALMEAGEAMTLDLKPSAGPSLEILPLGVPALQARLGWRVPAMEFSATPLAEVVALVNRHAPQPLVLAEPALGGLRISGFLRADNTTALLRLIELELGLVAEPAAGGSILLRTRPQGTRPGSSGNQISRPAPAGTGNT